MSDEEAPSVPATTESLPPLADVVSSLEGPTVTGPVQEVQPEPVTDPEEERRAKAEEERRIREAEELARRTVPDFRAEFRSEVLREYVGIARSIVGELALNLSPVGITSRAVDPSHVSMLTQEIDGSTLEGWVCQADGRLGIDLTKLQECLKLVKKGDMVTLGRADTPTKLRFGVGHFSRDMSVTDPQGISEPKIPSVTGAAVFRVPTDWVQQSLKAAGQISDHIVLSVRPHPEEAGVGLFSIRAEGENDRTGDELMVPWVREPVKSDLFVTKKKTVTDHDGHDTEIEVPFRDGEIRSMFPLDFSESFFRALKSGEEVTVELGNDYPLKVTFDTQMVVGKGREKATVRTGGGVFLLACRVESDD